MEPHQGLLVGEKYRLERLLAKGGMGSVWAAVHLKLDAWVGVKFMDPALAASPEMRSRFEREAKAAARLRSPHVVQVLDYGVEHGTPYIVMELLYGEDLRMRLKRRGYLELGEAASIVVQTCKALRLAGGAGLVHRDLKPSNIFLAQSGDDELVKVLDFGVAKGIRTTLGDQTSTGVLLGSPHYMSPEQARGGELDHRSDLFSMAVITFQMITGRRPFTGSEVGDVIVRICTDPVPKPSEMVPGMPVALDAFFERAMARDKAARFQSAREMADAFVAVARSCGADPLLLTISPGADEPSWPSGPQLSGRYENTPASFPNASARAWVRTEAPSAASTAEGVPWPIPPPRRRQRPVALVATGAVLMVIVALLWLRAGWLEPRPSASPALAGAAAETARAIRIPEEEPPAAMPEPSAAPSTAPPSKPRPVRRKPRPKAPSPEPTGKHPVLGI